MALNHLKKKKLVSREVRCRRSPISLKRKTSVDLGTLGKRESNRGASNSSLLETEMTFSKILCVKQPGTAGLGLTTEMRCIHRHFFKLNIYYHERVNVFFNYFPSSVSSLTHLKTDPNVPLTECGKTWSRRKERVAGPPGNLSRRLVTLKRQCPHAAFTLKTSTVPWSWLSV